MKRSLLSNLVCASLLVFLIGCGKEIKKKTVEQTFSLSELNSHGIEFRGGSDEFPEITVICNANKIATNFKRQESLRNLLSNINSNNISNKFIIGEKHLSYSEMDYIINQAITTLNYVDPSSTNCPIVLPKLIECRPTHFSVFKPSTRDLTGFFSSQDIIHVGGGNTKNLLCLWKEWGIDKALRTALQNGTVLTGMSAGMICWFEEDVTDSFGDGLEPLVGLGFLKGSACPHFDGEANRKASYLKFIQEKRISGGVALDDGAGALYVDGKIEEFVSSRPLAKAYTFDSETADEKVFQPKFLGNKLQL